MSKEVILTGIRANNDLTIGNYFGAILPMIDMAKKQAEKYQINLFVPDLHSFTTPIDHSLLQEQIMHTLRLFVAAGLPLDHGNIHIYRQSYISAHSELTWILDCFTGFGEIRRMTQFKEKSDAQKALEKLNTQFDDFKHKMEENFKKNSTIKSTDYGPDTTLKMLQVHKADLEASEEFMTKALEYAKRSEELEASVGLFNYPVLMAADILLYGATYVPVGDDQTQHLEFTRDIAERLNTRFGELFTVPEPVKKQHEFFGKDQGLRIKDLQDPTKKMSKSDDTGKGVIFLGDKPEVAAKKIMGAATDSVGSIHFDWDNQPGITNLLQILALATERTQEVVTKQWEGKGAYGDLKRAVAEAVTGFLQGIQARLGKVDDPALLKKLQESEDAMRITANQTLLRVQKAVGLR
jgi:tryptophanyl-tRNA synthetase